MKERLKQIRIAKGYSQQQMADELCMEVRRWRSYEYETRGLPSDVLKRLVDTFNVNLNYVFTGEGPMFLPQKSEKLQKYEQAFKERKTFGKRLNYYQAEENLMDDEIAKILDTSESRVEKLGLDKSEPTLTELRALKSHSGIPIDLWVDGELAGDSNTVTQMLSPEEKKMLEFLKKAKENKLI
ncbi:MAG: helix-turn-helix transcriptional regulator [Clostridium sp.]|nr:helix-turn-helix transcriptional regulator [Clostridium sp.]